MYTEQTVLSDLIQLGHFCWLVAKFRRLQQMAGRKRRSVIAHRIVASIQWSYHLYCYYYCFYPAMNVRWGLSCIVCDSGDSSIGLCKIGECEYTRGIAQ